MNKIFLSLILFFWTTSSWGTPPYEGVSVMGSFSHKENASIHQKMAPGFTAARQALQGIPNLNFHISTPDQYHVSLSILESTKAGTKLTKKDVKRIKKLTTQKINLKKGYKGTLYGLYAFAHGYDAKGNVIHETYTDPKKMQSLLPNGQDKTFKKGSLITHVHFIARYGTNLQGTKGPGLLKKDVTRFLDKVKDKRKKWKLRDIYDERGEFVAHLTLGVIKNHIGKNVTKQNPLNPTMVVNTYKTIYGSFDTWKKQQATSKKNDIFTLKHFVLSGEKTVNGKRQFFKTPLN